MSDVNPMLWAALTPIFLDFEASSLTGWPIEVGWAELVDGEIVSDGLLIRPAADWDTAEWDELAQAMHGIALADLTRSGRPAPEVADRLARMLEGRFIISDAAGFDSAFLRWLLDLLPEPPDLRITDIAAIARHLHPAASQRLRAHLEHHEPIHRAAQDAVALASAWRAAMAVGDG